MNAKELRKRTNAALHLEKEFVKIIGKAKELADLGKEELYWEKNINPSTLTTLIEAGYTPYYGMEHGIIFLLKVTW